MAGDVGQTLTFEARGEGIVNCDYDQDDDQYDDQDDDQDSDHDDGGGDSR